MENDPDECQAEPSDCSLAPAYRRNRIGRILQIIRGVVEYRGHSYGRPEWKIYWIHRGVKTLPVEVPVVDFNERPHCAIQIHNFDGNLSPQVVHVRRNGDDLAC